MNDVKPGHLKLRQAIMAMLGICLVLMLSALDQTVVSNALPTITADLNGFDYYAWVASSYLLTSIICIPIFGRLGDYYGRKPIVALAAVVFTLSSLGCSLSTNIIELVIGRAIQGIGGGMLAGTAFACVPELFPNPSQRLRWQVMLNASFSVVNALGPSLGGFLTTVFGWESIFYINLPIGIIGLIIVLRCLPWFKPERTTAFSLDWAGLIGICVSLCLLQVFVESLPNLLDSPLPTLYGIATVASFVVLILVEKRSNSPILPAAIFQHRDMRLIFIISVLAGGIMFALLFYIPLLCQGSFGYSSTHTGILITPMVLTTGISAIINTRIVRRVSNPNWIPRIGLMVLCIACLGMSLSNAHTPFILLLGFMLLAGIGFGFTFLNTTLFIQTLSEHQYLGISTAMVQALRLVGGMVATAGMSAITNIMYRSGISTRITADHTEALNALRSPQALLHAHISGVSSSAIAQARDVLGHSISIGLVGLTIMAILACISMWRVKPVDFMQRAS